MLYKIKDIFLTQYIGVIVTGMAIANGITGAAGALTLPLHSYLIYQIQSRHLSDNTSTSPWRLNWGMSLAPLVSAAVDFAFAYLLIRWLYLERGTRLLERLRDVLVSRYIGAVAIGVVAMNGVVHLSGIITEPLNTYSMYHAMRPLNSTFDYWTMSLGSLVSALFVFFIAYRVLLWLYRPSESGLNA